MQAFMLEVCLFLLSCMFASALNHHFLIIIVHCSLLLLFVMFRSWFLACLTHSSSCSSRPCIFFLIMVPSHSKCSISVHGSFLSLSTHGSVYTALLLMVCSHFCEGLFSHHFLLIFACFCSLCLFTLLGCLVAWLLVFVL